MSTPDAYAAYFESPAHWGKTYETVAPRERLRLDEAVCPTCGYRIEPPRANRLVRVANGSMQRAIGLAGGERPTQVVALFDRR